MNIRISVILALFAVSAVPLTSGAAKKKPPDRGMLEKMEAVTCGARERGLSGLGSVWASAGITHVNSDEKLCPQYLLRTDDMEYEIRPTENHAAVLPIGHEGEFKIKKDRMFLKVLDASDQRTRTYQVVSVKPTNSDTDAQDKTNTLPDKTSSNDKSTDKPADKPAEQP